MPSKKPLTNGLALEPLHVPQRIAKMKTEGHGPGAATVKHPKDKAFPLYNESYENESPRYEAQRGLDDQIEDISDYEQEQRA